MPIVPPTLDDRSFDDLVEEVLTRIPAHTPEWRNLQVGDPGRTMVELFAWLVDTLLYRVNLIPERQRLVFLKLLGIKMRPAIPARGIVTLATDSSYGKALNLMPLATIKGAAPFETLSEVTVLPIIAQAYYKRSLNPTEKNHFNQVLLGLQSIYKLGSTAPTPYMTTPIFVEGAPELSGFSLKTKTVDNCLWIALLAPEKQSIQNIKQALTKSENGGSPLLSIGVMPTIPMPDPFEDIGERAQIPHVWEISTGQTIADQPEYFRLTVVSDSSRGLTRRGVIRLALPSNPQFIATPSSNVRQLLEAGVGNYPPRIDAQDLSNRIVAWLRLRPTAPPSIQHLANAELPDLSLSWMGINAVEIDQRQTIRGRIVGQSDGSADQEFQLPGQSVEPSTLQIQVEETDRGYQLWRQIDDLALAKRDDRVYTLDSEAGTIRFGNGIQGKIPDSRIRVALMRSGGGSAGNLDAGLLTSISLAGGVAPPTKLTVLQPLPTDGGANAETLAQAERRIPALFRHRDRAVTQDDYRRIALETPGVRLGRVEVLAQFIPQQRRTGVPGVVSVMVLPFREAVSRDYPRADRPLLETVHAYLDSRRPLGTELYVIGCEYRPIAISVGVEIEDGFGRDGVLSAVQEALRRALWALPPGGSGTGWQLGKALQDRELQVVVARVAGVQSVYGLNLFQQQGPGWDYLQSVNGKAVKFVLKPWQLPELAAVVVVEGEDIPTKLEPFLTTTGLEPAGVAVPVIQEVCNGC